MHDVIARYKKAACVYSAAVKAITMRSFGTVPIQSIRKKKLLHLPYHRGKTWQLRKLLSHN